LGRKRLALAGRDMCREIPHSATPYHHFGNRSVHLGLCPHHRGNTLVTHFLNRQIYEKKKQDNRTAMQILRSGQHLRVYGIGLPQWKYIRLWGTIQGTQSERQKGVYHLSLFRGCPYPYPRNHFSNNLNIGTMEAFRFYQDRKVTCWERTHFEVTAENYEEAVALVKSWQGEDVLCFEDDEKIIITDGETLYDTSENLSIEENGGQPTIEVFADNGEDIINNKPDNIKRI